MLNGRHLHHSEYVPRAYDSFETKIDGKKLLLNDTTASKDYDRLRPLSYPGTNVFVLCFSVVDRQSFANIRERWLPEIASQNAQYLLVATKIDLRNDVETLQRLQERDPTFTPIQTTGGIELQKHIDNCIGYVECATKLTVEVEGISQIFNTIADKVTSMSFFRFFYYKKNTL